MPDVLDISHLRATGKQPDEEELADDTAPPAAPGSALHCFLKIVFIILITVIIIIIVIVSGSI